MLAQLQDAAASMIGMFGQTAQVELRTLTGSGSSDAWGGDEVWTTGTSEWFDAEVGMDGPSVKFGEGWQDGTRSTAFAISAYALGVDLNALADKFILNRRDAADATVRHKPEVLVGGQVVTVTDVQMDRLADLLLVQYLVTNATRTGT